MLPLTHLLDASCLHSRDVTTRSDLEAAAGRLSGWTEIGHTPGEDKRLAMYTKFVWESMSLIDDVDVDARQGLFI
jgi:hypothetical protein